MKNRNNVNNSYFIKDNQQGHLKISGKFNYSFLYTTTAKPADTLNSSVLESANLKKHLTVELNELQPTPTEASTKTRVDPLNLKKAKQRAQLLTQE